MSAAGNRDIVQELADDLAALTAGIVKDELVYLYDLDDVLFDKARRKGMRLPAMAMVYNSMIARGDARGRTVEVVFDIYLCAGRDRQERVDGSVKQIGTQALADVRGAIIKNECHPVPTGRHWEFVLERPVDIDTNLVTYLQRWRTKASTLC